MIDVVGSMLILMLQLLVVLGLLLGADRWLHRHLQGVMLLITGDQEIALWLYAIVLLPGVLLHEISHALVARLVGVKIGRISLLPKRVDRRIQLGFVPIQETDFLRASLIGGAPLILGSIAVVTIGYLVFGTPEILTALSQGDWRLSIEGFLHVLRAPDVWLWVYLVFTISNTLLPSRSDIHAWPLFGLVMAVVFGLLVIAGGTTLMLNGVGRFLTVAVRWVVLLGASTLLVDLPFFVGIFVLQKAIELRGQGTWLVPWVHDLSKPEILPIPFINPLPFEIPMYGSNIALLPIIMAVLTYFQNKATIKDPNQKMMIYFMPIFMLFLFNNFPSGLVLYWTFSSALGLAQQYWTDARKTKNSATANTPVLQKRT